MPRFYVPRHFTRAMRQEASDRLLGMARSNPSSPAPKATSGDAERRENLPNPVWFKPIMFGFMLLGLAWIIVYYLSQGSWPIPGINEANIAIGFGFLIIGFFMTTRWR
jgi:hypothetical protein